jgi:hypothetical protein
VEAEAHATQTPVDLAAMLSLSALATSCARYITVLAREGWTEPTNIFVCVALPPGSRKSAVFRDVMAPIASHQSEVGEAMRQDIESAKALARIAKERQTNAEEAAARKRGGDRIGVEAELRAATSELLEAEAAVPIAPRLFCNDATQEKLAVLLAEHNGCMALMDAEGCGPIATMLGRYSAANAPQVDVFLRAHAGDPIMVDRIGREHVAVSNPKLTVGTTIQPSVLESFGKQIQLRGVGLLGRFLWCVPQNTLGTRVARAAPVPDHVRRDYARALRDLLVLADKPNAEPRHVRFSVAADDLLADFENALEPRLGLGGDLAHLSDWAGKLAGAIVRIAGLLHAAELLQDAIATEVSAGTLARAICIGEYLLVHAQIALVFAFSDPLTLEAEHILAWFRSTRTREITARDLFCVHKGRYHKMARLKPILDWLKSHGWIREIEQSTEGRAGRRPSSIYRVHPSVHGAGV